MKATLRGAKELQSELERRFGKRKMQKITDYALTKGGGVVASIIARDMRSFAGTGKSYKSTTVSKPETVGGVREVKIHWNSNVPGERYRIIHLNEYGHFDRSGKWVNTAGKGVIENAMRKGRETYFATVKSELARRV
ncbi:hypothetical protein [Staphylococcus nepalensis]|uniref:hypothetical protein n=1 Tax=Staphylococcus nepalensis TaxID=214473 RepID=UPI000DFA1D48|nr:hypothetical protein [Staphylococcus nepalensis]SUM69799.1 bacteriophage protein [Staphylococcus nepalensis]SUM96058.1 bacteriophage protein [Staphylococcus nepalensis]